MRNSARTSQLIPPPPPSRPHSAIRRAMLQRVPSAFRRAVVRFARCGGVTIFGKWSPDGNLHIMGVCVCDGGEASPTPMCRASTRAGSTASMLDSQVPLYRKRPWDSGVRLELKTALKTDTFWSVKEGEVVLVLRILELLDPVDADGVPFRLPEGGDLVQTKSPGRYWHCSLDRARRFGVITPSALKTLEDLYLRGGAPIEAPSTSDA